MRGDRWIGVAISVAIHLVLWVGTSRTTRAPHVRLERGREAVTLTLLPSAASTPAKTSGQSPPEVQSSAIEVAEESTSTPVPEPPVPHEEHLDTPTEVIADDQSIAAHDQDGALMELGVDVPVQLTGELRPRYPFRSRRLGEEGQVTVEVEVLADGRAGSLEILSSSGYARLDEAALQALQSAQFEPAQRGGRPVRTRAEWTIVFQLESTPTR